MGCGGPRHGVTCGMEPDSLEFSTLGGWIATRASGMKKTRYGNIEDILLDVRVVTPAGVLEQNAVPGSALERVSTGVALPGLVLGSEGCVGVVVSASLRVFPLPTVRHQCVVTESVLLFKLDQVSRSSSSLHLRCWLLSFGCASVSSSVFDTL